jgi:hypothetical protein
MGLETNQVVMKLLNRSGHYSRGGHAETPLDFEAIRLIMSLSGP